MIILDTNVLSELMRPSPYLRVSDWVDRQDSTNLYTTAVTEAELRRGIEILPAGRRRNRLFEEMEKTLEEDFARRILPFDSVAARAYASIFAARRASGNSISMADCMIAAIARINNAPVATRDVDGFHNCGIEIINPWAD